MINIRRYSALDHDEVWRVHLLVIFEAGGQATHKHYHDIERIHEEYLMKGGEFLVGTDPDGTVIAMGGLIKLDENKAEIKRLRVHPDHQKKGYGQQILQKLEKKAVELGCKSIYLDTLTSQLNAQRMFVKNGYREVGESVIDGFDVTLFEKSIS
jgi:N-acetylglutamate synthase-like GNAT family acetyltransferase